MKKPISSTNVPLPSKGRAGVGSFLSAGVGSFKSWTGKSSSLTLLLFLMIVTGFAQYAPVSTIGSVDTYSSTTIIPITATNFNNIANCDLKIIYDPAVALATTVTGGPGLPGTLNSYTGIPGQILISWFTFPGVTLPDNAVIFNLGFSKVASGTTLISWFDDGLSCLWGDGNYNELIDIPTSSYYINGSVTFQNNNAPHTILPAISSCSGALADVPVKVTDFSNIGKVALTLQFDAAILGLQSWENISGFPGLSVNASPPGTILISGIIPVGGSGFSLPDSATLVNLRFTHPGGSSELTWSDNGSSCEYTGPPPAYHVLNDIPQSIYYIDGNVTQLEIPAPAGNISGPQGGSVCANQTGISFSIDPIANAVSYNWSFPEGFIILSGAGTYALTVETSDAPENGDVTVAGTNACGTGLTSPAFPVMANAPSPEPAGNISGPAEGNICPNQTGITFSVDPIVNAVSYHWSLPEGFIILAGAGTYCLTVETNDAPANGDVTVAGINACGTGLISPAFPVIANTPPNIITQPSSPGSVMAGTGSATFTVVADGAQLDFQWQEYISAWNDILDGGVYSDATTPSLTISEPPLSMNGYRYRCVVNGFCLPEAITDGLATLTVTPVTGINGNNSEIQELKIYPNPVTAQSLISFRVSEESDVTLNLMNMLGEKIFSKTEKTDYEGTYSVFFPYNVTGKGIFLLYIVIGHHGDIYTGQKKILCRE